MLSSHVKVKITHVFFTCEDILFQVTSNFMQIIFKYPGTKRLQK